MHHWGRGRGLGKGKALAENGKDGKGRGNLGNGQFRLVRAWTQRKTKTTGWTAEVSLQTSDLQQAKAKPEKPEKGLANPRQNATVWRVGWSVLTPYVLPVFHDDPSKYNMIEYDRTYICHSMPMIWLFYSWWPWLLLYDTCHILSLRKKMYWGLTVWSRLVRHRVAKTNFRWFSLWGVKL